MRVGIIKGGEVGESFKRYCAQNGVALTIIEYDETQELLDALGSGTLDGVAITHLGRSSVFRSVARFAPTPMYIAVSKQRPDLLAQINRSINDILLRNPDYRTDLYDKYLSPGSNIRFNIDILNSSNPDLRCLTADSRWAGGMITASQKILRYMGNA